MLQDFFEHFKKTNKTRENPYLKIQFYSPGQEKNFSKKVNVFQFFIIDLIFLPISYN